jgi:hypothetical protein
VYRFRCQITYALEPASQQEMLGVNSNVVLFAFVLGLDAEGLHFSLSFEVRHRGWFNYPGLLLHAERESTVP